MFARLLSSLRQSAWLLALLIITSALPARAQDGPYEFEYSYDLGGYIMKPLYGLTYDCVLDVPEVRESDGKPIVGVDGFSYQKQILGIFQDHILPFLNGHLLSYHLH